MVPSPSRRRPLDFEDVERLTADWPEVTTSTSYGTPSLKVAGKSFCRLWGERDFRKAEVGATEVLVVFCDLEEKPFLIEVGRGAIFNAPHYVNHGAVLIKLSTVTERALRDLLWSSYLMKAPPRVRRQTGNG
jgi:hypothetical protein